MTNSISSTVASLRDQNRKALVAYLTAGDPSLRFTHDIIIELQAAGVDILELGVPFNHPVGDGPVIQRSAARALENDTSLTDILSLVAGLREQGVVMPIVLFSYHNPIYAYGYEKLAKEASSAGISALLVVDLPAEESAGYRECFNSVGIDTVFLATPTTSSERLGLVEEVGSGFCYYVSRSGVTGGQQDLSASLALELQQVKKVISIPVFVGFGIRTAEHVRNIAPLADGVIVGSAFVECIEQSHDETEAKNRLLQLIGSLRQALDEPSSPVSE